MYDHTQYAPWWLLLVAVGGAQMLSAWMVPQTEPAVLLAVVGGGILTLAFCFQYLRIRDEGEYLSVRFGPIPLIGTRIRYSEIESAERDRTNILDGWGWHWTPGRGVTINIWGFDCVRIQVKGKTIRLGTDDPQGLINLLQLKMDLYRGQKPAIATERAGIRT